MSQYPIDRRLKHPTKNAIRGERLAYNTTYFKLENDDITINDASDLTRKGNSFNGANKLVELDALAQMPAVDGSKLTNVIASGLQPSTPYSVINTPVNANGYADFIDKVSETEISFDTTTSIIACFPNGSLETYTSLPNVSSISTDNTYYIIKEKSVNPYVTTMKPVESLVAPSTPATGQLWLDLSVLPHQPKKYNGVSWDVVQFVKLGQVVKTGGVLGTPISYALNGKAIKKTNAIGGNAFATVSHNIGTDKIIAEATLVCKTAEQGYSIGDKVFTMGSYNVDGINMYSMQADSLNASFGTLSTPPMIRKKGTTGWAYINTAYWDIEFIVRRSF